MPDSLFGRIRPAAALPGPGSGQPGGGATGQPWCCVAIDAEEDFDWARPVRTTLYSTDCMRRISDLQDILSAYRVRPSYLLTWPVLEDADVVARLRHQIERGACDVGVQLHPWVTPPFEGAAFDGPPLDGPGERGSYLGSLDPVLEERKLASLVGKFHDCFGRLPTIFRAGRYGLSQATTRLLETHGFLVDTSLAPRTDFRDQGGPDFSGYECAPFWFGEQRRLLEVPLCRSLVGWSGALAPFLYGAAASAPAFWHFPAVLSRLRCAERVTLSPEGNDVAAMRRFLRHRLARGQTVFSLSFHSSSLAPGRNPYVRSKAELHVFYDRLSAILDAMVSLGFGFAALAEMPGLLGEPSLSPSVSS